MPLTTQPHEQPPSRLIATKTIVDNLVVDFCNQKTYEAGSLNQSYAQFWETIGLYFSHGGKRLRPYLILLAYESYGGQDKRVIHHVAAAWEMLHGAMLMHDDIIDDDYKRHGHPNIAGSYLQIYKEHAGTRTTEHYANSTALLAGDVSLASAYEFIMASDLSSDEKVSASRMLFQAINTVISGELMDVEASMQPIGAIDPYKVAELKTAGYSFVSPLKIGAMLAGADDGELQSLADFGMAVGINYQLVDDMLSLFGNETTVGKSALSDIREGKRTAILNKTYELADAAQKQKIDEIFSSKYITDASLYILRQLAHDTGAKHEVDQTIQEYSSQANYSISALAIDEVFKNEFTWIAKMTEIRES